MTFDIDPGDICILAFPFNDLTGKKKRPVLALSRPDEYGDIRFAFITVKKPESHAVIKLESHDYAENYEALPRDCYVRLEKQFFLNKDVVIKKKTRLSQAKLELILRANVIKEIKPFSDEKYKISSFTPGESPVAVSGKVIGEQEIALITESALDGWLTTGRFNSQFERKLSEFLGVKHVLTTNSGSSANLLALATLTSEKLGNKALRKGDEVITVAAGFPTTVNPILQYGLIPVFIDIDIPTYNINVSRIEEAITDKTKAMMLSHTLGNPFNVQKVVQIARKYNLWLIEDCCDALGSNYTPTIDLQGPQGKTISANKARHVGAFGDIATLSFYPAHHITMGEGGAVYTNNGQLKQIIESFRDWGRDCFCPPGKDNTCRKRFCYHLGELPMGYDHKYTYSQTGYNLKITDMQAAIGLAQLERLPDFIELRKRNFSHMFKGLQHLQEFLILPRASECATPSWFGFPVTLKDYNRKAFIDYLEKKKIASRLLFGGNLIKQPYFNSQKYKVVGGLENTDKVMNKTLWLGVYPGLNEEMIDYIVKSIDDLFTGRG